MQRFIRLGIIALLIFAWRLPAHSQQLNDLLLASFRSCVNTTTSETIPCLQVLPQAPSSTTWTRGNVLVDLWTRSFQPQGDGRSLTIAGVAPYLNPVQAGTLANRPATCLANQQLYIVTNAQTPGQQLYLCNSTGNGWNLVGDGGSGSNASGIGACGATGVVITLNAAAAPTCTDAAVLATSLTNPLLIGGTGTTSTLTLRPTSGAGTTGSDIIFQTATNGAREAARITRTGRLSINSVPTSANNTDPLAPLSIGTQWCSNTYMPFGTRCGESVTLMELFDGPNNTGTIPISVWTRSLGKTLGYSTIGVESFSFCDETNTNSCWPFYTEGHRISQNNTAFGLGEHAVVNRYNSVPQIDPFTPYAAGDTIGAMIDCGNGQDITAMVEYSCSAGLYFLKNDAAASQVNNKGFGAGIVFGSLALDSTIHNPPHAIEMVAGTTSHAIVWMKDASTTVWNLYSDATSGANSIKLHATAVELTSSLGVAANANANAYFTITSSGTKMAALLGGGGSVTSTTDTAIYYGSSAWGYVNGWTRTASTTAALWGVASGGNFQVWTAASGDAQSTAPADSNARLTITNAGKVGINTPTPTSLLNINSNSTTATLPANQSGTALHITSADATPSIILFDTWGAAGNLVYRRSRGTLASPLALASGNSMGGQLAYGYDGTAYSANTSASLTFQASEAWTASAHGARMIFATTANGATTAATEQMRIENDGSILMTSLKTTGSAGSKKVVCVDTATGQLYASSTGTDCSN